MSLRNEEGLLFPFVCPVLGVLMQIEVNQPQPVKCVSEISSHHFPYNERNQPTNRSHNHIWKIIELWEDYDIDDIVVFY